MATLATYIALLPPILKEKFSDAFWIGAGNEILEILSSEGIVRELKYRRGVIVKYKKWITPPTNFRQPIKLTDPLDELTEITFEETDEKIMLNQVTVEEDSVPGLITAFTSSAVDSIVVNLTGYAKDDLAGCLLVITAGTGLNNTYVISGNDASGASTTKIYYELPLSAALGGAEATAGSIVHPDYYLMLFYRGSFIDLAATSTEVPIKNDFEKRIMKAGLLMIGYERLHGPNAEMTKLWTAKFDAVVMKVRDEFLQAGTSKNVAPRRWAGLVNDSDLNDNVEDD